MWFNAYDIFYYQKTNDNGVISVAIPEAFKMRVLSQQEREGVAFEPFMRLEANDAQLFMDELWNAGLRPTEGTGSAGSLAATERHLKDMRALVFKMGEPV